MAISELSIHRLYFVLLRIPHRRKVKRTTIRVREGRQWAERKVRGKGNFVERQMFFILFRIIFIFGFFGSVTKVPCFFSCLELHWIQYTLLCLLPGSSRRKPTGKKYPAWIVRTPIIILSSALECCGCRHTGTLIRS